MSDEKRQLHPPHSVVSRASTTTKHDRKLWYIRACDRRDELCPVLGNATGLCIFAHHEAGNVLQKHERYVALTAELNEMRTFEGGLGEQDAIVRDDSDLLAINACEARDERGAIVTLELGELGAVDDAGDDFMSGDLGFQVRPHNTIQLIRIVQRLTELDLPPLRTRPIQILNTPPREHQRMSIIHSEIVRHARNLTVQLATPKLFRRDNLPSRCFHKGRAGEEDGALVLDNDGLVRHGWDVGAAGGAGAHDDGDLGYVHRGHWVAFSEGFWIARGRGGSTSSLVIEDATEVVSVGKDVRLVREVGAAGVDEIDAWEALSSLSISGVERHAFSHVMWSIRFS